MLFWNTLPIILRFIADRIGQFASGAAPEMLGQAQTLFILYKDADHSSMERRIREETFGTNGIADLKTGP